MSTVGAPLRGDDSSPTATGFPPSPCSEALPPASVTRAQAHSAASLRAPASPPPVDIDGMRRNSNNSSSSRSLMSAALEIALQLPVRHDLVVEDQLLLPGGVEQMLEHEVTERGASDLTCLLYTSPSPRDGLLSRMP